MKPSEIYRYRVFFRIPAPPSISKFAVYFEGYDPAKGCNMVTEVSSPGREMVKSELLDTIAWHLNQKRIYVHKDSIEVLSIYRIV